AAGRGGTGFALDRAALQTIADDLQREEVLPLLAQDDAQPLDVAVVELAVARWRALRVDQPLALQEPDLGDRDVGELLEQQPEDLTDRQVRSIRHPLAHRSVPGRSEEHTSELQSHLNLVCRLL